MHYSKKIIPHYRDVLVCHPMFGPQSAKNGTKGLQLVVCEQTGSAVEFLALANKALGLEVLYMNADEHDRIMADMHALTFFLARGLTDYGVVKQKLHAPSYDWLLGLAKLDKSHSDSLYRTIQTHNPYAAVAREKMIKVLTDLTSN